METMAKVGLMVAIVIALDMGAAALWSVGQKEQLAWKVNRRGRRVFKKSRRQRWWSYRIWMVSCFLKTLLFYLAVIRWIRFGSP